MQGHDGCILQRLSVKFSLQVKFISLELQKSAVECAMQHSVEINSHYSTSLKEVLALESASKPGTSDQVRACLRRRRRGTLDWPGEKTSNLKRLLLTDKTRERARERERQREEGT